MALEGVAPRGITMARGREEGRGEGMALRKNWEGSSGLPFPIGQPDGGGSLVVQ